MLLSNDTIRRLIIGSILFSFCYFIATAFPYIFGGVVLSLIVIIGILVRYREKQKKQEAHLGK